MTPQTAMSPDSKKTKQNKNKHKTTIIIIIIIIKLGSPRSVTVEGFGVCLNGGKRPIQGQ